MTAGLDTKTLYPERPVVIRSFEPPTSADLEGQPSFKYASLEKALKYCVPYVRRVVESVELSGKYKYTLLDVKIVDLKKGQLPCLPGWHLDCTMHPEHKTKPETHHIFVWGAGCRTRFVVSPIEIPTANGRLIEADRAVREQKPEVFQVDECTLTRYYRDNLHAPSKATKAGKRILIRITETDLVKPNPIKL